MNLKKYLWPASVIVFGILMWFVRGWYEDSKQVEQVKMTAEAKENTRNVQDAVTAEVVTADEKRQRQIQIEYKEAIRYVEKIIPVTDNTVLPDSFRVYYNATVRREFPDPATIPDAAGRGTAANPG